MKNVQIKSNFSLMGIILFVILFLLTLSAFSLSANAADETAAIPSSTPLPLPSPDALIGNNAYVSDLTYNKAVLNCKLPEDLNGRTFSVIYEYWTEDAPDIIMKSTLNRTYTKDTFTTLDSQLIMGLYADKQYFFRAKLFIVDTEINEIHLSKIVAFKGAPAPTAPVNYPVISGYVAPDIKTVSSSGRDGFKVVLNEGIAQTITDKDGQFSFEVAKSSTVYYKIRISKPGYIERIIDLGYNCFNKSANQNGPYTTMLCGDLNQDRCINMADIMVIAASFNMTSGNEKFNKIADLNEDNAVNMTDIMLTAKNFNKSSKDYLSLPQLPYVELKSSTSNIYPLFAYPNQTITIDLMAYNMKNLGGYDVNIAYNPGFVQPVGYTSETLPKDGDMFVNKSFSPFAVAKNDLETGNLFFGKTYLDLKAYINSGAEETSGKLASIEFKVIGGGYLGDDKLIKISKTDALPDNDYGLQLLDWNCKPIKDIEIIQPRISFSPMP